MSTPDRLTDDGQANDCPHLSASGVDTAPIGPEKVWRCDHCGLSWVDQGDGRAARLAAHPPATDRAALAEQVRPAPDPWCREESCRHRHWRSGDMPTHRRGDDCPIVAETAARPAPDTLADRVQALAEEWERNYSAMLIGGFSGCSIGADTAAKRLRALLAGRREPTLADHVQAISDLIDGSYPSDLPAESRLTRRVVKVAEESGEVIEALFGVIGENPRKGVTHTVNNLRAELLDVAVAALGAVAHFDPGDPIQHLAEHAEFVHDRLSRALLAGRSDASPEGGA